MSLRWKIFAVINIIQMVYCMIIMTAFLYGIYKINPSLSSIKTNLPVFLIVTLSTLSLTLFSVINLNTLKLNYPAKLFSNLKNTLFIILLILAFLSITTYLFVLFYGIYDIAFKKIWPHHKNAMLALATLAVLVSFGIYIIIDAAKLKKEIFNRHYTDELKDIEKIGNDQ